MERRAGNLDEVLDLNKDIRQLRDHKDGFVAVAAVRSREHENVLIAAIQLYPDQLGDRGNELSTGYYCMKYYGHWKGGCWIRITS